MNNKYERIVQPERYWESVSETEQDVRKLVLMLLQKVDQLNERVWDAQVHSEDAYQETVRLRAETGVVTAELRNEIKRLETCR